MPPFAWGSGADERTPWREQNGAASGGEGTAGKRETFQMVSEVEATKPLTFIETYPTAFLSFVHFTYRYLRGEAKPIGPNPDASPLLRRSVRVQGSVARRSCRNS